MGEKALAVGASASSYEATSLEKKTLPIIGAEKEFPDEPPPIYDLLHPDLRTARRVGTRFPSLPSLPAYEDLLPPLAASRLALGNRLGPIVKVLKGQSWKVTMEPPLSWMDQLYEFTQNTTFHGIRFVFDVEGIAIRRILWGCIILASVGYFSVQMADAIERLQSNPTIDQREIQYQRNQTFPAVTICNHNLYRTSVAAENGIYGALSSLFGNDTEVEPGSAERLAASNTTEILLALAHQQDDLIFRCLWQGSDCPEGALTRVLSDKGVCYTFNWNASGPLLTENAGSNYGLSLILNVEQYEYMAGPRKTAGVRVIIHSAQTVVDPTNNGIDVPPGYQASVGISETRISTEGGNAKCPKSTLRYWRDKEYTANTCTLECESDYVEEVCRCHRVQVPNADNIFASCDIGKHLYDKYECVDQSISLLKDNHTNIPFDCSVKCNQTCDSSTYNPVLSYSSLSRYNAEKILNDEQAKIDKIRANFQRAREFNARFNEKDTESDQANFRIIERIFDDLGYLHIAPEPGVLRLLGADLLNISCFVNARRIVAQYRGFLEDGLVSLGELPVFAYERSFFLRSFRLLLDTAALRLANFQTELDSGLAQGGAEQYQRLATKVNFERIRNVGYISAVAKKMSATSERLDAFVEEHPFLRNLSSFNDNYEVLPEFRAQLGACIAHLNRTVDVGLARIRDEILSGYANRNRVRAAFAEPIAARSRCEVPLCLAYLERHAAAQMLLVRYSSFDRELWKAAMDKELEELGRDARVEYRTFDNFVRQVEDPGITLAGARDIQGGFRRLQRQYQTEEISKLELAELVTSEDFVDRVEYFVNFLGLVDRYLFRADDALSGYLREFGRLKEKTPEVLRQLLRLRANTDYRLYFLDNLFTAEEGNWRRLHSQLAEFYSRSTLDASFVLTNFAQVQIFFRNMQIESVRKEAGYGINNFVTEMGGNCGLFFGASFMTIAELIDVFIYTAFKKYLYQRHQYLQKNELQNPSHFLTSKLVA